MKISLIGMSGSGKTYWSKKLASFGFKLFCCDDLIEYKLASELKRLGYSGIKDVAAWMGQPYEKKYQSASKKYLGFEKEVLEELFLTIGQSLESDKDVVIDTTGSVIYCGGSLLKKLSRLTRIVYLEVPESVKDKMYRLYISDPKPVIWGNSFSKEREEKNMDALERCYPNLLKYRTGRYKNLADITFDYFLLRNKNFNLERFIKLIKNK